MIQNAETQQELAFERAAHAGADGLPQPPHTVLERVLVYVQGLGGFRHAAAGLVVRSGGGEHRLKLAPAEALAELAVHPSDEFLLALRGAPHEIGETALGVCYVEDSALPLLAERQGLAAGGARLLLRGTEMSRAELHGSRRGVLGAGVGAQQIISVASAAFVTLPPAS